jgi:hypothetical protein
MLPTYDVTVYQPQSVTKTNSLPTFAHYMPWFGSKEYSGTWTHWGNNADNFVSPGKRDIPMVYYPLIDLYDSNDPAYMEYALLCMKLSGIDGIFIDYYSEMQLYDYPFDFKRTTAAMDMADKVGLKYAVVYEDNILTAVYNADQGVHPLTYYLTNNVNYLKKNIFNRSNYLMVNGKPLFMIFGPSANLTGTQWRSVIQQDVSFVSVFWKPQDAVFKASVDGTMAWTGQSSATNYELDQCLANYSLCIAGAMPGFETVPSTSNNADPRNGDNFREALNYAKTKNPTLLQIPTWNDWGEGTNIEPSVELGYQRLQIVQQFLGVQYTTDDLALCVQLYQKRKQYKGKQYENQVLDQVFYYIVSLQMDKARSLIATI